MLLTENRPSGFQQKSKGLMEERVQKGFILFGIFFRGMMFAFTNGLAALPSIERGIVDKRKWMTNEEFWTYPVLGQSLPGVVSVHNSILIGNRIAGPFGGFMCALGVIMPAFFCMFGIAALFQTLVDNPFVQGAIRGIRVISVVIILENAHRLLRTIPRRAFPAILVMIGILVPLLCDFSAFWTIITCGIAGIISILIEQRGAESGAPAPGKKDQ